MKKCYHCKISFIHAGDPIDGNDFCNHVCSGNYIHSIIEEYHQGGDENEGEKKEDVQTKVDRDSLVGTD